jgi:hypothetical protein
MIFFRTNPKYLEILILAKKLDAAEIPYEMETSGQGWVLYYPRCNSDSSVGIGKMEENCVCMVMEYNNSWGSENDLLEVSGIPVMKSEKDYDIFPQFRGTCESEDDEWELGDLTAEYVYDRISQHYHENKESVDEIVKDRYSLRKSHKWLKGTIRKDNYSNLRKCLNI